MNDSILFFEESFEDSRSLPDPSGGENSSNQENFQLSIGVEKGIKEQNQFESNDKNSTLFKVI
jgi:hypothetical protein